MMTLCSGIADFQTRALFSMVFSMPFRALSMASHLPISTKPPGTLFESFIVICGALLFVFRLNLLIINSLGWVMLKPRSRAIFVRAVAYLPLILMLISLGVSTVVLCFVVILMSIVVVFVKRLINSI